MPSVGQHQIAGMAKNPDNGPGAGHEKIADNESDKKIAQLFKQPDTPVTHTQGVAGPSDEKTEP
jgi:hypothetical protein